MLLLLIYLFIALGFSFLCSIAEAVLLSLNSAYIRVLEQEGKPSGKLLRRFKDDVDTPLAAILSLNTIAHTVGAAGVGAQAAVVFGDNALAITSAILTLLILVFSEIIPKTLGTYYWRQLAPATAWLLKYLIVFLAPLIWLSKRITGKLGHGQTLTGFNRQEFAAMAELGEHEGELDDRESSIMKNLLKLNELRVKDVMTPKTVVFALPETMTLESFFAEHQQQTFSRIPIYKNDDSDQITGFVLRNDILAALADDQHQLTLEELKRELPALLHKQDLFRALTELLSERRPMMLAVDEYGSIKGLLTLEDVLETLIGLEIVDEGDRTPDMQKLAKKLLRERAKKSGINLDRSSDSNE